MTDEERAKLKKSPFSAAQKLAIARVENFIEDFRAIDALGDQIDGKLEERFTGTTEIVFRFDKESEGADPGSD